MGRPLEVGLEPSEKGEVFMKFLKEFARNCYWYGEETGDYDMNVVEKKDWFQELLLEIPKLIKLE